MLPSRMWQPHAVCSITRDVTDRKQAEADARRLREDLGGMQTRGTLESGIAHALAARGNGRRP